jgi:hypothetical protein
VVLAGRYSNRADLQKLEAARAKTQVEGASAVPGSADAPHRRRARPQQARHPHAASGPTQREHLNAHSHGRADTVLSLIVKAGLRLAGA